MTSRRANTALNDKLTVGAEFRRRELLAFLRSDGPAWQEHDQPEIAAGTAAWVRNLRRESDRRRRP